MSLTSPTPTPTPTHREVLTELLSVALDVANLAETIADRAFGSAPAGVGTKEDHEPVTLPEHTVALAAALNRAREALARLAGVA